MTSGVYDATFLFHKLLTCLWARFGYNHALQDFE